MDNKEKLLIGFLVTAGLFSFSQAGQYVRQLTDIQKSELVLVADSGTLADTEPPRLIDTDNNRLG